ncbi:MAG: methyltransferase domain-containing protein [Candidatus Hydrogenedens sp.]|nr:methyltransferase domain-containing protein [Candidatus Hydrogenedens sp.]
MNPYGAEYFGANYRDYAAQNPERKLAFYRALLREASPQGGRLLELGCAFAPLLRSMGPEWRRFGCDMSAHALAEARRADPGAGYAAASGEALPYAGPFDAIAACDVLEHIPGIDRAGSEIDRLLRPGGALLFVVPVYDGPTGPIIQVLDKDPTHVHKRARGFWLDWAAERWTVERWLGIYRYLLPGGYYAHWPTRLLRHATPAIAVVARKPG